MPLPPLTLLDDRYAVRRTLDDAHPIGCAYLGWSVEEEKHVVIHEYFPAALAERAEDGLGVQPRAPQEKASFQAGLKYFLEETAALSQAEHASLPDVHPPIEAHGTAYRVVAHHPGTSLTEALAGRGGRISEQTALAIMQPVLAALHAAHQSGLVHGGLSPRAVFLTKDRRTLLTGFQGAYVRLARETGALAGVIQAGTSPVEQYTSRGRQGPWTDVYAAAATLYRMVAGEDLPDALTRAEGEDPVPALLRNHDAFSKGMRDVLLQALAVKPKARVPSAEALGELLLASPPAASSPKRAHKKEPEAAPAPPARLTQAADEEETAGLTADENAPAEKTAAAVYEAPLAEEQTREKQTEEARAEREELAEDEPPSKEAPASKDRMRAPQTEPTRPARRLGGGKKAALMAGGVLLLLVLMGGSVLAMLGNDATASPEVRYATLRAEADSLFLHAEYAAAGRRYKEALSLQPDASDEAQIRERLREIEALRASERDALYAASIGQADSLEARARALLQDGQETEAERHYEAASQVYFIALDNRPGDSLATARIEVIGERLAEASGGEAARPETEDPEAEEDPAAAAYTRLRTEGDAAFAEGAFAEAQQKYQAALAYRPGDAYLSGRLQEAEAQLKDAEYIRHLQQAEALAREEEYARARIAYEQALAVRPGDATVQARLRRLDGLETEAAESAEEYQYHRARGDVLYDEDRYEEAIESYRQALDARPGDAHATDRIATSRAKLKARTAEVQRKAGALENGAYTIVDQEPKLIGGLAELHKKVSYPARAARLGLEGRVTVRFIVTEDGRARDARVLKGVGGGADEEALRVIKEARFTPARLDGEAVPAWHALWVQFKLSD